MNGKSAFTIAGLLILGLTLYLAGCGSSDSEPNQANTIDFEKCLGNSVVYPGIGPSSLKRMLAGELKPGTYVPGEILVKFAEGMTRTRAMGMFSGSGTAIQNRLSAAGQPWDRWMKVKLAERTSVKSAMPGFAAMAEVEYVQPNYIYTISAAPTDPDYGQLWGLKNTGQTINDPYEPWKGVAGVDMDLEDAWDTRTDCSSVLVAIIDSGVNYNQEDLIDNMWDGTGCPTGYDCSKHGYDFVDNDNDPMDLNGHGTHVAGTIGALANNGVGISGVCWKSKIMAVRVINACGYATTENISDGMNFAATAGAKVVNLSIGDPGYDKWDQKWFDASVNLRNAGVIMVVAAGNDSVDNDKKFSNPGCYDLDNIINVGAIDPKGQLAWYSNYGAISVDVAGPGTAILSTYAGKEETIPILDEWEWNFEPEADGWSFADCQGYRILADPNDYCQGGMYENNINHQVWRNVDLSPYDSACLDTTISVHVNKGDFVRMAKKSDGGNPFSGGIILFSWENMDYDNYYYPGVLPLFNTADFTLGFQLETNDSGQNRGVAITSTYIDVLALKTNEYMYEQGTSMAAPHVVGVVALLWAQYPQATYKDIILAVFDGSKPMESLSGKTCTGGLVNAKNSLALLEDRMK
jgi:thermitase